MLQNVSKMLAYCWNLIWFLVKSCWKLNLWILSRTVEAPQRNVVFTSVSSCKFVLFLRPVFVTFNKLWFIPESSLLEKIWPWTGCISHTINIHGPDVFFSTTATGAIEASGDSSAELWTLRVQALLEVEVVGPRHGALSKLVMWFMDTIRLINQLIW